MFLSLFFASRFGAKQQPRAELQEGYAIGFGAQGDAGFAGAVGAFGDPDAPDIWAAPGAAGAAEAGASPSSEKAAPQNGQISCLMPAMTAHFLPHSGQI